MIRPKFRSQSHAKSNKKISLIDDSDASESDSETKEHLKLMYSAVESLKGRVLNSKHTITSSCSDIDTNSIASSSTHNTSTSSSQLSSTSKFPRPQDAKRGGGGKIYRRRGQTEETNVAFKLIHIAPRGH